TLAGNVVLRRTGIELPYGTPIVTGDYTVTVTLRAPDASGVSNVAPPTAPNPHGERRLADPLAATGYNPIFTGAPPLPMTSPAPRIAIGTPREGIPSIQPTPAAPAVRTKDDSVGGVPGEIRREIHKQLLEFLDLAKMDATKFDDPSMRPKVLTALRRI